LVLFDSDVSRAELILDLIGKYNSAAKTQQGLPQGKGAASRQQAFQTFHVKKAFLDVALQIGSEIALRS
jgi:hypothetical protein